MTRNMATIARAFFACTLVLSFGCSLQPEGDKKDKQVEQLRVIDDKKEFREKVAPFASEHTTKSGQAMIGILKSDRFAMGSDTFFIEMQLHKNTEEGFIELFRMKERSAVARKANLKWKKNEAGDLEVSSTEHSGVVGTVIRDSKNLEKFYFRFSRIDWLPELKQREIVGNYYRVVKE